jgi:hypothetical protein
MTGPKLRDKLLQINDWGSAKHLYDGIKFDSPPFERIEAYGMSEHQLHTKLPNLHKFWRYHIAPATNRRQDTHLASTVGHVTSRMAERSYEVYANICDAFDELKIIKATEPEPPRYRRCLNVLRYTGDAFFLFDELVEVIGTRFSRVRQFTGARDNLATILNTDIRLFPDWYGRWKNDRDKAIAYRNMLVHHGRPWLHFDGDEEFVGLPYVLRAEHCAYAGSKRDKKEFLTWLEQRQLFKDPKERTKFVGLPDACAETCRQTVSWLNRAYGRILEELDQKLSDRHRFAEYKARCWGVTR